MMFPPPASPAAHNPTSRTAPLPSTLPPAPSFSQRPGASSAQRAATAPPTQPAATGKTDASHAAAAPGRHAQSAPDPAPKDGAIRVLVADDHKIVREGLVLTLGADSSIELVGEAENGREAIDLTRQTHPDVVVMDVSMPVLDGIEATRQLRQEAPQVKVIGLSMHDSEEIREALLNAGADAYLTKNGATEELVEAIRRCKG